MFEKVEFVGSTAIFRRTDAPVFDPLGDGWWLQDFNRRRASFLKDIYLKDGKKRTPISSRNVLSCGRLRRGRPSVRLRQSGQPEAAPAAPAFPAASATEGTQVPARG